MTQQQLDQQQLQDLAEQLSEQEAINAEREAQLDEKEEELNALRATLQQDLEDLRRQEQSINDRSRNLDRREQQLDDREGGLQVHEDALAQRDREIREREDRLTAIANLPENLRKPVELGALSFDEALQKMREEILPTPEKKPRFEWLKNLSPWRTLGCGIVAAIAVPAILVITIGMWLWLGSFFQVSPVQERPAISQPVQQRPANTVVPTATPWWPLPCDSDAEKSYVLNQVKIANDGYFDLHADWDNITFSPELLKSNSNARQIADEWLKDTPYCDK